MSYPFMRWDDFMVRVRRNLDQHPSWRYGQALYNTLDEVTPQLATEINGTEADCFHAYSAKDPRIRAFTAVVFDRLSSDAPAQTSRSIR